MWQTVFALTYKNLRQRYNQAHLKSAWTLLQPLIGPGVLTLVFSRIARFSSEGVPYPVFSLTGIIPWSFFLVSTLLSCGSLLGNKPLLLRIPFPRIAVPLSCVLTAFADFLVSFAVLLVILPFVHHTPGPAALWLIPVIVIQCLLHAGLALLLSISSVYYRDIPHIVRSALPLGMLVSPVAYSANIALERTHGLARFNPLFGIIDAYHRVLLHGQAPDLFSISVSFIFSAALFVLGFWLFSRGQDEALDFA